MSGSAADGPGVGDGAEAEAEPQGRTCGERSAERMASSHRNCSSPAAALGERHVRATSAREHDKRDVTTGARNNG